MSQLSLSNPFQTLAEMVERILDRLTQILGAIESLRGTALVAGAAHACELHPDWSYSPAEAARILGMKQTSVNKIDPALLPRHGKGRVCGVDLMAYRGDVSREEAAAYKQAQRNTVVGRIEAAPEMPTAVRRTPVTASA